MTEMELDDAEDEAENQMLAEYSAGGCLNHGCLLIMLIGVALFTFVFFSSAIM